MSYSQAQIVGFIVPKKKVIINVGFTGPRWGRYYVGPIQFMVCYGAVVAGTLLGGQCMKVSIC